MGEATELLSTITEFSIGLAGFSGVIGVFIHGSGGWLLVDRFRITNLLVMSLTPGFLAFLTLGLFQVSSQLAATRISAGVFAATIAILLFFIPRARARIPERDQYLVGLRVFIPMSSAFAIVLVVQALVAAGVISSHIFTLYYYSLVVLLLLAVVQFARLILARPEADSAQ